MKDMIINYNINGNLKCNDNSKFNVCRPQRRLYRDILFGIINKFGINISKLRLSLMSLFPASFSCFCIEFLSVEEKTNIEYLACSDEVSKLDIRFRLVVYDFNSVLCIGNYCEYVVPLLSLPKLLFSDTIIVENVEKVFVSQLCSIFGVHVNIDGDIVNISLITPGVNTLLIQVKDNNCEIICGDRSSEYLMTLVSLGLKYSHLLKLVLDEFKIIFLRKKWNKLNYIFPEGRFNYNINYGKRRLIRIIKVFSVLKNNSFCLVENINGVLGSNKKIVLNNLNVVLDYASILNVVVSFDFNKFFNKKISYEDGISEILASDISSIKLDLASRKRFNSIICNKLDYDLDLLTKGDFISIWNNYLRMNFDNSNIKIVRGIGDIIVGIVEDVFMSILHPNVICYTIDVFIFDKISMLINRIQADTDKILVSSGLCQYIDQVNSLSELSHKLRLTYVGVGVSSINTEMSVRDIHKWYFGKVCPIESPEGQNIGLVSVFAAYSNIDVNGNIVTVYYKVYKGLVSNNVVYLNNEDKYIVLCDSLVIRKFLCFKKNKSLCNIRDVDLCVPMNCQIFSNAVNLIPFLGYNDASRALMAANMQKQAIPLLLPHYPLVGTGEEALVMKNTCNNIIASSFGVVINVDSIRVVVFEVIKNSYKVYLLPKPRGNNQNMCVRFRPVVDVFKIVNSGDIIAECQSSSSGDLSLGINLLGAFMCWNGFNYEDSVLISSDVISRGSFYSFHITEFEIKVNSTNYGDDILTNDIYSIPIENRVHLPKDGIVRVGCVVKEGDVLVGKLSFLPNDEDVDNDFNKGIEENEKKLINKEVNKKINNEKSNDSSLKVPEGIDFAYVLEVLRINVNKYKDSSFEEYIYACNCLNKNYIRRIFVLTNQGKGLVMNIENSNSVDTYKYSVIQNGIKLLNVSYKLRLDEIFQYYFLKVKNRLNDTSFMGSKVLDIIKVKLLVRKSIRAGDKICGRHGNKGVISRIVPKEDMPFMADGTPVDIVFNPLSVPSRMNLGQILEVNFGLISYKFGLEFKCLLEMYKFNKDKAILQIAINKFCEIKPDIEFYNKESVLKFIHELSGGVKLCCPSFIEIKNKYIENFSKRVGLKNSSGQIQLYDGRTGLPFDRKSTVGIIYVFKLNHLVDDKMHSRSTGPYSVVTQQPLKGKTNKGGQRLGEMEIWALQSYGAAYMIKEVLTSKCDDFISRKIMYKSILNNNPILINTWSESLLVLIKELCSLCIKVKFNCNKGEGY